MTKDESRAGLEALRNQLLASGVPCAALGAFEDEIRAEAAQRVRKAIDDAGDDCIGWPMITGEKLRAAIIGKETTK